MALVYLDTCVYLDYWRDRRDRLRPLGEFAFQLIRRAISCEFEIVVSDWVLKELRKELGERDIAAIFTPLSERGKLIAVSTSAEDRKSAMAMGGHWQDALHAVLAAKAGAECVVTRNIADFLPFQQVAKARLPEEM